VVYLVGSEAAVRDVAEHAARHLSRYLLPSVYVKLDALPLTP
jgi:acyl-CoA synthetase (AMP-forming)/AMP-acid ligase II